MFSCAVRSTFFFGAMVAGAVLSEGLVLRCVVVDLAGANLVVGRAKFCAKTD